MADYRYTLDARGNGIGTSTPWGRAQGSKRLAYGIVLYYTAGHGGIHVSPTVLATMPAHLRNADGWYEEDCEVAKVVLAFPALFTEEQRASAQRTYDTYFAPKAAPEPEEAPRCKACTEFFARFSCGKAVHLECDCPKCQGYCECRV